MAVGGAVNFEVDDGTSIGQREMCEMCYKTELDGYCSQCEIHICQICFDNHLNSKLCRDHVLLHVHDTDRGKSQSSCIRFDNCSEHKQQEVKAYCTEHKCCICIECIVMHHKSCKWEYIVDASNRFQDSGDLARLLEDVQSLEYTLHKYMEAVDEQKKSAATIDKDAVSVIETFAKSLVAYIAGSKQQALDDAKVQDSAHQQKLDKLKVVIQSLRSQVEEIITDFRDENTLHKRFILAVETIPKLARIQNDVAAIDCYNVITDYTFRPGNILKRMMSDTRPIGRLTSTRQTEEDEEDNEVITLKKECERRQGIEPQLEENQKMMSKLKKDVHEMEQTYDRIVKDKQSLEQQIGVQKSSNQNVVLELNKVIGDLKKNYDRIVSKLKHELGDMKLKQGKIVKDKKCLEQDICTLKSENQKVVRRLNKELGDVKQNYNKAVKEKQSLEQQIDTQKSSNQHVISKLNKELSDLKQNSDNVVSKLNKDLVDTKQKLDRAVKEKQSLELQIDAQKSRNQNVVSKLNKDLVDMKQKYDRAVKEKQSLELQIDAEKSRNQEILSKMKQDLDYVKQHGPAVTLSCGHENLIGDLSKHELITCSTCGIINGDQPNGRLTIDYEEWYIELLFTFPKGTQSKLNRNPGQQYSAKTVIGYLRNDREGSLILDMMKIAFHRKCLFTVDIHGNIRNRVELYNLWRLELFISG